MRVLDLTKAEDVKAFGKSYWKYKDQVSLPKEVFDQIEIEVKAYKENDITAQELSNYIIEIVTDYIDDLNSK